MSDTMMIVTGTAGVAATICGLGWAYANSTIQELRQEAIADVRLINILNEKAARYREELDTHRAKAAVRRAQLSSAGKAGRAKQIAAASETKAERERLANMATAKTMAEMSKTALRPRDEVVAGVHAKRAAKKAAATA